MIYFSAPIWTVISSFLIICSTYLWMRAIPFLTEKELSSNPHILTYIFSSLIIIFFLFQVTKRLSLQRLRNQPSYIFYACFGTAITTYTYAILHWLFHFSIPQLDLLINDQFISFLFYLSPMGIIGVYFLISKNDPGNEILRFAPGSVSRQDDQLNFLPTAKNEAQVIQRNTDYVSVFCLSGGMGSGKSSFARIMIESISDRNEFLYSYISLTETNMANDFSKLFTERWFETLSNRYPLLRMDQITNGVSSLRPVLRDSGHGFLESFFSLIVHFNHGLIKTRSRVCDHFLNHSQPNVSPAIAQMFGNIPSIHEKFWLIVVDEIERAHPHEIYRVIEVIERYKAEGRSGLPLRIIFLLCISDEDLRKELKFRSRDPIPGLIKGFFFDDPKSITKRIHLPPVPRKLKKMFILNSLQKIRNDLKIKDDLNDLSNKFDEFVYVNDYNNVERITEGFADDQKALIHIHHTLLEENFRVVYRTMQEIQCWYQGFQEETEGKAKDYIRFIDIAVLSYVRVRYPYIIEFFTKTVELLLPRYNDQVQSYENHYLSEDIKKKKIPLEEWIKTVTGQKISEDDIIIIIRLMRVSASCYIKFFKSDNLLKTEPGYYESASSPENLNDYLVHVLENHGSFFKKGYELYQKHKQDKDSLKDLGIREFMDYTRFLSQIKDYDQSVFESTAQRLFKALVEQEIKLKPGSVGDTPYKDALYRLIFLLKEIAKNTDVNDSSTLEFPRKLFKEILLSDRINVVSKYIILSSFVIRSAGSKVDIELNSAFGKIQTGDQEISGVIRYVIKEADLKYFDGNEIVYKNEENFPYLFYQSWSGQADDMNGIEKIRNAAIRKLEEYPDIVEHYWEQYPYEKGWKNLNHVLESSSFFREKRKDQVYMPLKNLVEISDKLNFNEKPKLIEKVIFWKSILTSQGQEFNNIVKLRGDQTLKSGLKDLGYL